MDFNDFNCNYQHFDYEPFQFQQQQQVENCFYQQEHVNDVDQLPFVQIHTTHVDPSPENYSNPRIYRRPQNEIKSEELIKEELNNQSERVSRNSTPTTSTTTTAATQLPLTVFKCTQCPFLSILQENLQKHELEKHAPHMGGYTAPPVMCPGCANIFNWRKSFESHLQFDHQMEESEMGLLVADLFPATESETLPQPKQKISIKSVDVLREELQPQKPKIYIKNVDILKKPLFDVVIPNNLRFSDSPLLFNSFEQDILPSMKPKSKIYLKDTSEMLEQRNPSNFIHLRTVDEVNLMHRNEVENLIVPNEDGLWQNFGDLESSVQCLNEEEPSTNSHFDLNTPEVLIPLSIPQESDDDPEILFVCAEEIINANSFGNESQEVYELQSTEETTLATTPVNVDLDTPPATEDQLDDPIQTQPAEKGRIYVSENLMAEKSPKKTGKPRGVNNFSKMKKLFGSTIEGTVKCDVTGCGFRFKKQETLEYHKKCHVDVSTKMKCPECSTDEHSSWNTLHTHLWRNHSIDMELYSCDMCKFKTPIYSRLTNTHMKIHSDERNYQCDQCSKAFKNSKQLKNHRRLHRNSGSNAINNSSCPLHKCDECGAAFTHLKSLKAHSCKTSDIEQVKCPVCEKLLSSKSACKLHLLTHENPSKFKCNVCTYASNDHNAFRRHKLQHDDGKLYECQFCDAKIIQSTSYQKHIQQQHPEHASKVILKCSVCPFTTLSKNLLNVHQSKHSTVAAEHQDEGCLEVQQDTTDIESEPPQIRNKIKVKSDLVLLNNATDNV